MGRETRRAKGESVEDLKKALELRARELEASEQRFRNVISKNADGIIIVDRRGIVRFVNPAAETLFDRESADLLGEMFGFPLVAGETTEVDVVRRGGQTVVAEMRLVETEWEGELAYVATLRDITERKRAEEERARLIREQAARAEAEAAARRSTFLAEVSAALSSSLDYRTSLQEAACLVALYLADYCAVDVIEGDRGLCRFACAHADADKQELAQDLRRQPPDLNEAKTIARVLRAGEMEAVRDAGTLSNELATPAVEAARIAQEMNPSCGLFVPLLLNGQAIGVITLAVAAPRGFELTDMALAESIAQRAALAIEHARLYQQAQEANRIKDEFLATVSHELRTPLNAILGWIQLLRTGRLGAEESAHALETIERSARSQAQIIEDLLDVSRIITGRMRISPRPVDLSEIIDAAIDAVRLAADARNITIHKSLDPAATLISGDADRLQQVIWNLLSNGIKFSPKNARVDITLERDGSNARITVSDTGRGINPEFLPYVFDRFRQADSSTTRQYGGLGLGLAIVRHLVEVHGGKVQAKSEGEGKGATFIITLPILAVRESVETPEPLREAAPAAASRDGLPSLAGVRALIVDDEPETRRLLAALLTRCGAEPVAAASVSEALREMEKSRFDILISDIGMPGEDGYSLIQKVRALPEEQGGNIPAVALTAYARAEDRTKALAAGYQRHVAKPVEPVELALVVASLVQCAPSEPETA
ncbi:MAG TPA: ATP-binding protein [Blastocatellia bacterium]|nr:ATP-binding protein [Blastocatellia bacterium]